jgi:hypothetical protein
MGDMVIVAYRPKPGQEAELLALTMLHVPTLRRLGLATDRSALAMRSRDGVIVEVFEWRKGAIETAHSSPEVAQMWARYDAVSEYVPLHDLPEAREMFAQFEPLDLI